MDIGDALNTEDTDGTVATRQTAHDAGVEVVAPRLSVVVACHNAQDVLGVQLAALAAQTCPVGWELLICDNGSDDDSVAVARSWADRLPLRVVVADSAPGAGPARNAGVEAARGQWIGFCDADDEVGDGWLEVLCAALAEHAFVAGSFEGTRLNSPRTLRSRALDQQTGLQHSSPVVALPHAGGGNLGIHRSVFRTVAGFDPSVRYLQDTDLCWRVQLTGVPLVFVPDLVVHVRLRSTLRGMYRQGRNYGASLARLERRYAGRTVPDTTIDLTSADPAAVEARARVRSTGTAVDDRTAPGTGPAAEPGRAAAAAVLAMHDEPHTTSTSTSTGTSTSTSTSCDTAPTAPPPPAGVGTRLRSAVRLAQGAARLGRHFLVNRSSLGAQAWQIGWHVGHRS